MKTLVVLAFLSFSLLSWGQEPMVGIDGAEGPSDIMRADQVKPKKAAFLKGSAARKLDSTSQAVRAKKNGPVHEAAQENKLNEETNQ